MPEIDRAGCEKLLAVILPAVRDYLAEPPPGRERVFSALNVLAIVAGYMLSQTGAEEPRVHQWFADAVIEAADDAAARNRA